MSRYILIDRPTCQVVLGFDHMLRSFFGQVFNPANKRREGIAVGGWPTRSGLGMRRPARTCAERDEDLCLLIEWARGTQPEDLWEHPDAAAHLEALRSILRFEWEEGEDDDSPALPALMARALS